MGGRKRGGSEKDLEAKGEKIVQSLRSKLAEVAPDHWELIQGALVEAIQTRKRAKGYCDHCRRFVVVEIQDSTAAVNAIKVLIEQAEGRPGVAGEDVREKMKIVRWVAPDPSLLDLPKWQELAGSGDLESLLELKDLILSAGHEVVLYEA